MATLTAMQGLWSVIESMKLTRSNRKWLSDKLIMPAPAKAKTYSKEDQQILDGFRQAIRDWKDESIPTRPLDESMAQLKKELEEEGYEFD